MMFLMQGAAFRRPFFLGGAVSPTVLLLLPGSDHWSTPANILRSRDHGWWDLDLTASELETAGAVRYAFFGVPIASQPVDQVVAAGFPQIPDPAALSAALADLEQGYAPLVTVDQLLARPLGQYLLKPLSL